MNSGTLNSGTLNSGTLNSGTMSPVTPLKALESGVSASD